MPVRSDALGAELDARLCEVTTRQMLAYAAGIGETGAHTFDDAGPDLMAPRSFCVTLEWPVLSAPRRRRLLGLQPEEALRAVHVEQDSTFHAPIHAGDRLRTSGRITAIRATAAGAFVQYRLETINVLDDSPVTSTWYGTIVRGVGIDGEGGVVEDPPAWPKPTPDLTGSLTIPIAPEAAHVYTECSGIWNPIHSERRVALDAGLPGVILHGTATWAIAGRELIRRYGAGDPATLLRLRARFRAPVIPGTMLSLRHGCSTVGIHFQVDRDDGLPAVIDGYASFGAHGSFTNLSSLPTDFGCPQV